MFGHIQNAIFYFLYNSDFFFCYFHLILVFAICHVQIETCRKVENALKRFDRKGIRARVLPFHAALEQESRLANMEEFRRSQSKDSSLFLVCTDRYHRFLHFSL